MDKKSDNTFILLIVAVLFIFSFIFISNMTTEKNKMTLSKEIFIQKSKNEYSLQGYILNKNVEKRADYLIMSGHIIPPPSYDILLNKYYIEIKNQQFELPKKDWNLVVEGDNVEITYNGLYKIKSINKTPELPLFAESLY